MVDYNSFSDTFSKSRKNMKWQEIYYFLDFIIKRNNTNSLDWVLDIWCWNARLINMISEKMNLKNYLWIDLSENLVKEAKKINPWYDFISWNMLDILNYSLIKTKVFSYIFLIASFHHLETIEDRLFFLKSINSILDENTLIFFTNWDLRSDINLEKYKSSMIKWSKNEFCSYDYNIKIWSYYRYYHSFSLKELEYLLKVTWYDIIENRLFENKRNIITIATVK